MSFRSNFCHKGIKMCESLGISEKYCETGDVVDSKIRKFFFKLHDKEIEKDLRVTIRIISGERTEDQKVVIELTSDSNPVFLFSLFITKSDFETLRNEQGLNVDFKDFPVALVNLLNKCSEGVSSASGGIFKLVLEDYCGTVSGGCLMDMKKFKIKILEECAFRNMCHLTLDVLRGSEIQIQRKLEMELSKVKQNLSKESKLHDEALKKISELVEDLNERSKTIKDLNEFINNLKIQKEEECKKEHLQAENKEKQLREQYEKRLYQEQEKFQKKFDESQTKLQVLEEEIKKLNGKHHDMTSQILEKEKELEITKAELTAAKQEISLLKNQNSKLDSDYHDKEKAVNILRTRLAVTEQELKDNNVLLLNHQKKLDEASKEKIDIQNNLDFIKAKLEKKESVVLNLSEELLKGNEIISKQQAKISVLKSKLKESEETILEKEKIIKEKGTDLQKTDEVVSNLQEKLDQVNKQASVLNNKIVFVENELKEKNEKLERYSKIISIMKENLQNHNVVLKPSSSQRSLLYYRAFLSTPSLLPSDECRRIIELKQLFHKHQTDVYNNLDYDVTASGTRIKSSNIIEPYLARYLKRFVSIPSTLFRSDIPTTVLSSPDGMAVSKAMHDYCPASLFGGPFCDEGNVVTNRNEYLAFTKPIQSYPNRLVPDSSISNSGNIKRSQQPLVVPYSSESNNSQDKRKSSAEQDSKSNPQYAPVGGFRFRPIVRHSEFTDISHIPLNEKTDNSSIKPSLRKTPAVAAPPLTREQKQMKNLPLKYQRLQEHKTTRRGKSEEPAHVPVPLRIGISSPVENTQNFLRNIPHQSKSATHMATTQSNSSKKIPEEPEPSAYFVG